MGKLCFNQRARPKITNQKGQQQRRETGSYNQLRCKLQQIGYGNTNSLQEEAEDCNVQRIIIIEDIWKKL